MVFFKPTQYAAPAAPSGIWVCPHESLDLEGAQKLALYHPPGYEISYSERLRICPCRELVNMIHCNIKSNTTSLRTHIPIWEVEFVGDAEACIRRLFRPDRIEQLLCSLDAPICAHLRTSDWQVATSYRGHNMFKRLHQEFTPRHCHNSRSNALSPDAPHMAPCLRCHKAGTHTLFGFNTAHVDTTGENLLILELCIIRGLAGLTDLDSPSWEMHSSTPSIPSQIRPYSWDCWQDVRDRKTQLWLDRPEIDANIEARRAKLDTMQAKLDAIPEARPIQKPRGWFIAFFNKLSKLEIPQQISQEQNLSTAKTEQIPQDNHTNTAKTLYQMPVAECEIDRCCITWNARDPVNRSKHGQRSNEFSHCSVMS